MPSPETAALLRSLRAQRRHVLGILEGLDDEVLHRPVLPSGWTPVGLVAHLTADVEEFWFQAVVAGDREVIDRLDGGAWTVTADAAPAEVLETYRQACARSDEVIAARSPDDAPAWWPEDLFPPGHRMDDLRTIVLHVVAETACHAGHLDAARELIDGRLWIVLD